MLFNQDEYNKSKYQRLLKMENAIIHYSGGIHNLEMRTRHEIMKLNDNESDLAVLLNDYLRYLRDIAIVGQLQNNVYYSISKRKY